MLQLPLNKVKNIYVYDEDVHLIADVNENGLGGMGLLQIGTLSFNSMFVTKWEVKWEM